MNHYMVQALATQYGVPVDAVLSYLDGMVGLEMATDLDAALDTVVPVLGLADQGDHAIDTAIKGQPGYRGKHAR